MCWKICFSVFRSKVFVRKLKVLDYEPWPRGYKCKDHEVFLSWFWMSACFVQWVTQSFWSAHFTEMQRHAISVTGIPKYSILKKLWAEVRGASKDVFPRCTSNSSLAVHFHLNLESHRSRYHLVFPWHLVMHSPQCSAMFQIYSAVNESGWIHRLS